MSCKTPNIRQRPGFTVGGALLLLLLFLSSCFGTGRELKTDGPTPQLTVNRGANRYVFRVVRTAAERPPVASAAIPVVQSPPDGLTEIAIINGAAEFSGFGAQGLAFSEAELYPEIAVLAQQVGATHFKVAKTTNANYGYLMSLTISAMAPPPKP